MSDNAARRFYQGEGELLDCALDPSVITYYVVMPVKVEAGQDISASLSNFDQIYANYERNTLRSIRRPTIETGCKLIAVIPCSDIFGVDLVIDQYQKQLSERLAIIDKI